MEAFPKFDIRNTLPRLQHNFCTLWSEIAQEARKQGHYSALVYILREIRHHYIALHQGTDAAPTAFSASTNKYDDILHDPLSYPFCIASHRPDSIPQIPVPYSIGHHVINFPQPPIHLAIPPSQTDSDSPALRQAEQVKNVVEPPSISNPTTTSEIGATSHGPDATWPTSPVHSDSRPTRAGGVVKINKPVQFSPELDIPFGMFFIFTLATTETEDIS